MRHHLLAPIVFLSASMIAACGGGSGASKPPSSGTTDTSSGGAPNGGTAADGAGGAAADAGPTTTTTTSLGNNGDLQGAKLETKSQSTTTEVKTDGPKPDGKGDPGRRREDIQALVVAHRDEARKCYDDALKSHPGIEGDLDVKWVIDPKGAVGDISVDDSKSTIHEQSVGDCIIGILKKIKFAESAKGFETRTHYPFNFHPRMSQQQKPANGGSGSSGSK